MKNLIILFLCALSQFSFANSSETASQNSYNPEKIYKALTVTPVKMQSGNAAVETLRKTVGGLFCEYHNNSLHPQNSGYYCQIAWQAERLNFESIYHALRVKEINQSSSRPGDYRVIKAVGGLVCSKSGSPMQPNFSCTLD